MQYFKYNIQEATRLLCQMLVSPKIFSFPGLYFFRWLVFRLFFKAPKGVIIGYNVVLHRQHKFKDGFCKISKGCLIGDNVKLDYSGGVTMEENTTISEGSIVISHSHELLSDNFHKPSPTPLILRKNSWIASGCIIIAGVKEIGENSVVQAGTVVSKKVKPNVIVGGNPMKTVAELPNWLV